ncbi:hypothetical protein [Mucilaginibacter sp.]|uniref:hypothetical protein n=1 Tax=Mucilaginibacter sp. TaxID=1882438 RepID=UPI0035BBE81A
MERQIKKFEVWLTVIFVTWAVTAYLLELLLVNMYTRNDSAVLFWCAVAVFLPAGVYFAIPMAAKENARWYKYIGYSVMTSLFLIFVGYFTLLKTDLLWSLLTKPTTSGVVYIKSLKKDYLPKHGWDHTNVNTIYNNKRLQFEASRTAFFLLKDKDSLNVTIGCSNTGNYFITDIHLPGVERWDARKTYWVDWVQRNLWVAVLLIFAFMVAILKERYWPNATFAQIGWKRFVLICVSIVVIIFIIIYVGLIVYIKFIHKR